MQIGRPCNFPATIRRLALALAMVVVGCGSSPEGTSGTNLPSETEPACPPIESFGTTWEALYHRTIEEKSCANDLCHGASATLDLSPMVAWENLVGQPATGSPWLLVDPGNAVDSYMWRKLYAKVYPGSVDINGSPMPADGGALSPDHLDAWRSWINTGASRTDTNPQTEALLKTCGTSSDDLAPLPAPKRNAGVQFILPSWHLAAGVEREVCFARYYDLTGSVPRKFLSNDGERFRVNGYAIRQNTQSHHMALSSYSGPFDTDHPAFGQWSCMGGAQDRQPCDPKNEDACGEGHCISEIVDSPGCIGFGPPGDPDQAEINSGLLTQTAYEERRFPDEVFSEFPIKGIQYINWHAFNLNSDEILIDGAVNLTFSSRGTSQLIEISSGTVIDPIPAYTTAVQCHSWEAPQGAHVFEITPHTHRFGRHVWVETSDGTRLLESRSYSDPTRVIFDPPLILDDTNPANRTLTICANYNNGVDEQGNPDPTTVKRYSRQTPNALIGRCEPTHCWSGRVGATCGGIGRHEDCNTAPDSNDGLCDACTLSGGVSTEDEMLLLLGAYWLDHHR